jgi:nitroimidazol reductase NimA-like FMN-containing flavoprotein (pyridoxamine 5'-phosphate oxidase superfamily)
MRTITPTPRTEVHRLPKRASYDRAVLDAILDEALVCHVGFVGDGQPFVLPTIYSRIADQLYLHGSAASRMLRTVGDGVPACVTVTLIDGLVLARSAFHHSMNYRSVVILGTATAVTDRAEQLLALEAITDHVLPGRWAEVRPPTAQELKATLVLRLPIAEASVKIRTGPPIDDEEDYALPCWAGVLPLALTPRPPVDDPRLAAGITAPPTLHAYRRPAMTG